jgi:hypothetical protein
MKNALIAFYLLSLIALSDACGTHQSATSAPAPVNPVVGKYTATELIQKLDEQKVNADWMSSGLDMDVQSPSLSMGLGGEARYRKDSIIWMTVKKFGIEMARVKVTQDSAFMIDRYHSTYSAESLKFVEQKYNLPANFDALQRILLGLPVYMIDKKLLKLTTDDAGNYTLSGTNGTREVKYTIDPNTTKIIQMNFLEPASGKNVIITYSDYGNLPDGQSFAFVRNLQLESPETGKMSAKIEIEKSVEINVPKKLKFDIPSGYTRKN